MNRITLLIPILVLSLFLVTSVSRADVLIVDIESNIRFSGAASFSGGLINTGSGNVADYELIACGTVNPNSSNTFFPTKRGD